MNNYISKFLLSISIAIVIYFFIKNEGLIDYNQEYNGTGWTSLTVLPATRGYAGGAGIQTLSMIVGGNIEHLTRVMTTTISLETSKGNLTLALALGMILVMMSIAVNASVFIIRDSVRRDPK